MKKVFSADNPLEARLVAGMLEEHGIAAVIQGEALWSARGELPLTPESAPSVWVADDEAACRARELIQARDAPLNPPHCLDCGYDLRDLPDPRCPECGRPFRQAHSRKCPSCGERCEGPFTHCWNCGSPIAPPE